MEAARVGGGPHLLLSASVAGPVLTLLGKPDCHLCHEMAAVVQRVLAELGGRLVERDVREDPELEQRYRLEIPVLLWDGRELARHRITEAELRRRLSGSSGSATSREKPARPG